MALLSPNHTYSVNGVTVCEKIIPDGTRWKNAFKAASAGFGANSLYKKEKRLTQDTGKPKYVTIHNTDDLEGVADDGEQYTRATYNENMGSARIHFYVDDSCAWQNLKAGTGMSPNDPDGSAEVSWHAGDGSIVDGGNMTSLSIEIIMNDTDEHDQKARDNGARLAAWLLYKHDLKLNSLVTHTYWVNRSAGKYFSDVDTQCASPIYTRKWCPAYIFGSTNPTTALANWKSFKCLVGTYLAELYRVQEGLISSEKKLVTPYIVRIKNSAVSIRSAPNIDCKICGNAAPGAYTIVAESEGKGASKWGKLKSGAGWIPLDTTVKL